MSYQISTLLLIFSLFSACTTSNLSLKPKVDSPKKKLEDRELKIKPYFANGKYYYPKYYRVGETFRGEATWYGELFHNRESASGEIYNMYKLTAAHRTFPFDTRVLVTNLKNQKSIEVRINDRGPFDESKIVELSYQAAKELDLIKEVKKTVELKILSTLKEPIDTLKKSNGYIEYRIKKGDTLYRISRRFDVSLNRIKILNSLNSNIIKVGDILKIPTDNSKEEVIYIVRDGDTIESIAKLFNISSKEIESRNKSTKLRVGDRIVIPR